MAPVIPVLSEYLKHFSEYSAKYGSRVAVLMQVGSFYEMYGTEDAASRLGNAEELSRILNIVLTRRNKKMPANSTNNPLMLGFPCLALDKYVSMLTEEDYTVVIVNQEKTQSGISRTVADVVSPSININTTAPAGLSNNYLALVYVDRHRHIGLSAISVITGDSVIHECCHDPGDPDKPMDEALEFLKQYRPREVVLSGESINGLESYLELDGVLCHKRPDNKGKRLSVEYQNSVLGLAFSNTSMLSNIEDLGLDRSPFALMSYVMLIDFVYDHNPMLLKRMSHPEVFSACSRLVLSTSTVDQLDVAGPPSARRLGSRGRHTLLSVVNMCATSAGKRLLTKRILAPAVDANEIDTRYSQIDELGTLPDAVLQGVSRLLRKVVDIERLQRRMSVGILVPSELASLTMSYEAILELDSLLRAETNKPCFVHLGKAAMPGNDRDGLLGFVEMCRYAFDIERMLTSSIAFNGGVFGRVDKLRNSIQVQKDRIADFAINIGVDNPRIEYNSSLGHCVSMTSQQAKAAQQYAKAHKIILNVKQCASSTKVSCREIEPASDMIVQLSDELESYTQRLYESTVNCLLSYSPALDSAVRFVSGIDVISSNLTVSKMYSYCRPAVADSGASFVDTKGLRHPVIERIDNGETYVPNDVSLGKGHNGIVLYSMNSCGKTSLLRALGLSVILAQAGCFVPASSFAFRPFKCIMTRILSRDNIMKGQSSFVAEMAELRAILKRAKDCSTLVLADEITHGTEHTSGSAIFVSSVEALAKRGVNFLFTTHLHNVYPLVQAVPSVRVLHLSVSFNDNKIVFERKLRDGPGGSIYGLEVCELLNMDTEFIARAFQIRTMVTPDKADEYIKAKPRPSNYNAKKMVQHCEECGYSPKVPTDASLDTHHVVHQALADANGMIGSTHKNALSNLKVLCKKCHAKEH